MLVAEARLETERATWYLGKLCQHFDHKAAALPEVNYRGETHPFTAARVEWSDDIGVASFGWGRCTLHADEESLTVRAEAADAENLRRVELLVADHLERFGRRERLTVSWTVPHHTVEEFSGTRFSDNRGGQAHG